MIMCDTISYYDNLANEYAAKTIYADMSQVYSRFQKYLAANASILDVGCGSGRDSLYFLNEGYSVTAIDASKSMCAYAEQLLKHPVLNAAIETVAFNEKYDGIWACASLLHVQERDMINVMHKLCGFLTANGVLYASWKYGDIERTESSTGRLFCDMNEKRILDILGQIENIELCELWISEDVRTNYRNQQWLNIIIRKLI